MIVVQIVTGASTEMFGNLTIALSGVGAGLDQLFRPPVGLAEPPERRSYEVYGLVV